jgi:fatty-acyl-CoA synthase
MVGGAAFPKGLARKALEMGVDAYAASGMSETCPVLTVCNVKPHMLGWDLGKQLDVRIKRGLPIPLTLLRIVEETGSDVPRDGATPGEIIVRSPWLTQGYLKETERSEELWRDGWLHTGDVAVMDEEGYVRITDRLKDMIKTGGEWVSSLELENLLSLHEAVSEAAVVGVPHEKWGERPYAFAVLRPEYEGVVTAEELRAFLDGFARKGVISKWAIPDQIQIVKEIPKTRVGKINKREIRSRLKGYSGT